MGAGRTELFMSLFGAYGSVQGRSVMHGRRGIKEPATHPEASPIVRRRKGNGLVLGMDVLSTYPGFPAQCPAVRPCRRPGPALASGVINILQEVVVTSYVNGWPSRPVIEQLVKNLSAATSRRWCWPNGSSPNLRLILDERLGHRRGRKFEIYNIMNDS